MNRARQYRLDLAYHGDRYARARVLTSELIPEELKQPIALAGGEVQGAETLLQGIQFGLMSQVDTVVETIETTARTAFSDAITGMFGTSLWIILLGFVITLFIPVIPLQDRHQSPGQSKEESVPA